MSPPVATESMYKQATISHDETLAALKSKPALATPAAPTKTIFKPEPVENLNPIKFAPIKVFTPTSFDCILLALLTCV